MRITLLGGTGFVGHQLCHQLSKAGHTLRILSRNASTHRDLLLIPRIQLVNTDVYDVSALTEQFTAADAVINLVGILNERGFGGGGFRRAHVALTEAVLAACEASGVRRLLHMSALGAGAGHSHYLISKGQAQDKVLDAYQAGIVQPTIFQPSVIFGNGDSFINRFAGLLKLSPVLPLARPQARFQPVWVNDVASAFLAALNNPRTIGKVYQLGGPDRYSLIEIVRYIAEQLALRRWIIPLPDTLARLQALVMDCVPGKPFSSDNYKSLLVDSITTHDDWPALGVSPRAMKTIVPQYLNPPRRQSRLNHYRRQARRTWPH